MDTPEQTEDAFFQALRDGDADALAGLLAGDFRIVDVMSGNVADGDAFVGALRAGALRFDRVDLLEREVRRYGPAAVIVGRTEMAGAFADAPFAAASRYTHVLVEDGGAWRLVSAQGTPVAQAQS